MKVFETTFFIWFRPEDPGRDCEGEAQGGSSPVGELRPRGYLAIVLGCQGESEAEKKTQYLNHRGHHLNQKRICRGLDGKSEIGGCWHCLPGALELLE